MHAQTQPLGSCKADPIKYRINKSIQAQLVVHVENIKVFLA